MNLDDTIAVRQRNAGTLTNAGVAELDGPEVLPRLAEEGSRRIRPRSGEFYSWDFVFR